MKVIDILEGRFRATEYVIMAEVSDKAGFRNGSADFIAVGLWPSRGCPIIGFELKSNRADWLKELKNPIKAESFFQYCNQWYLLTDKPDVAKIEEIPATWGWLEIKNDKVYTKKEAPQLEPIDLKKNFTVCLLRRAASKDGYTRNDLIEHKIEEARKSGEAQRERKTVDTQKNHDRLESAIQAFKESCGIDLMEGPVWSWSKEDVAKKGIQLKRLMQYQETFTNQESALRNLLERSKKITESLESVMAPLPNPPHN